jgi:hypothetical protein
LVKNNAQILYRQGLLLSYFSQSQEHGLFHREITFGFGVLADFAIQVFD